MDAQNKKETLIQAAASPNVREDGKELLAGGFSLVPGGTLVENIPREHGVNIHLEKGDYTPLIEALRQHLNEPISDALIAAIKKNIVDFFREKKGIAVVALIPIQKIVNGNIILQILEGKVGRIEYKNQNWFSERVIRNALGIKVGDPLNEVEFLNDVTWLNRNPFRHTQMVLVPAKEKGMTDLSFVTTDRFPFRFYAGSDNCGYITNGTLRLFAGFNWGNAFMLGDLLSYQYTASSNFHNLQTHVLNYSSFLPWKNILTVFGCYGQVFPKIPGFKTSGINLQGSFRYEIPIPPLYGSFRSSSSFGFDYKFLTSNLFFVGNPNEVNPASNQMMAITQFLGNYQFQRNWPHDFFSMRLDMVVSPWKNFVPHQSTSAYTALRQGSHVRYAYWKSAINYIHKMKSKWTASFLARGQLSSATLPTAEQFGLGGADTVRGYFEQQFVADDALCLNFELYPPGFPLFKGVKNELAFLTFFDYGYGYNYTALDPQFVHQNLIGIGPGIRFDIPPYLTTKMDYGFQVLGVPGDHRTGRFHFAITASY
jgi:hemolysin activation/secretion protein